MQVGSIISLSVGEGVDNNYVICKCYVVSVCSFRGG